jgi:hypothetical protein
MRRIGVNAGGESHPLVYADRHITGRHIHDATKGRGAIEGGARAFEDVDPFDLIDRHEIPIDAATIALVHRHAVHQEEHAGVQPLHVSRRAADIDLPVQELNGRLFVDGFVDRVYRSPVDLFRADLRNARRRMISKRGNFVLTTSSRG